MKPNKRNLKILLLMLEFPTWKLARSWSYGTGLGIEEGFAAHGVQYLTITTPWFDRAREICAGRQFDQVWLDIGRHDHLDESWLEWIATLAPVRVGLIAESIFCHSGEDAIQPQFLKWQQNVIQRLKYVTHVVTCDEKDVDHLNGMTSVPAMWWPMCVPPRILKASKGGGNDFAVFYGRIYPKRAKWLINPELEKWLAEPISGSNGLSSSFMSKVKYRFLESFMKGRSSWWAWLKHPELRDIFVNFPSPERYTAYPLLFNGLHLAVRAFNRTGSPNCDKALSWYLPMLRLTRRACYAQWLRALEVGCAMVNLPHYVKTYASRVVEGMAVGRPVISWEIPDRPMNKALFEDGKEILLFQANDPVQLATQIHRVLKDPQLRTRLVANAFKKMKQFHTWDIRIGQIFRWIDTGESAQFY
ncbi:MAG: glycosyltransferase [Thermodesulfobacteriota bacterium]